MTQIMDVIVIGCGASGIAALRKLHDAGLKVLGLEAAGRIGGRIHSVPFGDAYVDLGATWCHGEIDNKVFELANPLNLLGRPVPEELVYYKSNGEVSEVGGDIIKFLDQVLAKADKDNDKGISETLRNGLKTCEHLKSDPELTNAVLEWYERNSHVGGQGDSRTGKSLRGLVERQSCAGEFWLHWKGQGYKTLLDVLLNKYPDPSKEIPLKILLNKDVVTIKWCAAEEQPNSLVQVKCRDGSLYMAKSVIVTMSVGVLKKRHTSIFNPPLPSEKVTAINTLQFCVLGKIYVEFERPWWTGFIKFPILWRKEEKVLFQNEQWITEIFQIQAVDGHSNVLLFWLYGNGAKSMETVPLDGVKRGIEKLLKVAFKKFDVTPIRDLVRSQWASDPYTCGAYAYRSVMTEQDGGGAVTLSEPLCHNGTPVVCFAGEATSHTRHSDVHGALEAGIREADRLIGIYKPN